MPGCKPLDSVALEMIRCFMLALDCRGSGWITLDFNVGYKALQLPVAVHGTDEGGFGIAWILTERVDKPLTFLLHT